MRFSLLTLFAVLTLAALGIAALIYPSTLWTASMYNLVVFMLIGAGVGAKSLSGRSRAFCHGFVIAGILYVLLTGLTGGAKFFVTEVAFDYANKLLEDERIDSGDPFAASPRGPFKYDPFDEAPWAIGASRRRVIEECLSVLLLSIIGGCLAVYFESRHKPRGSGMLVPDSS